MLTGILPRQHLPGYARSLCHVSTENLALPAGQVQPPGTLGDLSAEDHVVVQSCSKALFASLRGLKCRVSYWMREPPAIQGRFYRSMRGFARRYWSVLTYDQKLCRSIPNARFVAHGGCWIHQPELAGDGQKTKGISIIASPKRDTTGHRLRHAVIDWAKDAHVSLEAFGAQYQTLDDKRDAHEPFRFSVVVENSRTSNYFTEKLIDSFVCLSLPIYWGTPDIANYFDPEGMLVCTDLEDLQRQISRATPDLFERKLAALRENRRRALRYVDPHALVFNALRGACPVEFAANNPVANQEPPRSTQNRTPTVPQIEQVAG